MTIDLPNWLESRTSHRARTVRLVTGGAMGLAMAAALVGVSTGSASAAPGDGNPDGSTDGHVVVTAGITLTGLTSDFTMTGIPGATIDNTDSAVSYNVETNNPSGYTVTVTPAADDLVGTGLNGDVINVQRLTVLNSDDSFQPMGTGSLPTTVLVHTQDVRSEIDGDGLTSSFKMLVPNVSQDTYTATLNYVAATQ